MIKESILICLLLAIVDTAAGAAFNPSVCWMQHETEHFIIIYDAEHPALADSAAIIAERMYDSVTVLLRHEPPVKTALILADNIDAVNAHTAMLWYPHIVIAPVQIPPLDIAGGGARWLALVIAHELTHAVQLDMTGGIPGFLRKLFGRIVYNNALQPYWAVEGPAVYAESRFTGAGRGQGGIYSMMLRTAVRDSCMLGLDRIANYELIGWPAGGSSYLYGNALIGYLTDVYGDSMIAVFNGRYKKSLLLFNRSFKKTTGKSAGTFYRDWKAAYTAGQRALLDSIRQEGETASIRLTRRGYLAGSPAWFPNNEVIAYTCATDNLHPQLRVLNLSTGRDARIRTFINGATRSAVSVSPDGTRLAYAELMPQDLYTTYGDLYVYDFRTHASNRITYGARGRSPAWSPAGDMLVYTTVSPAGSDIKTVRPDGTGTTTLMARDGYVFSHPSWSPEGNRIIISYSLNGTGGLCLYDFAEPDSLTLLTAGNHIDADPSWSPDGKYIVFTSNRTGIFNLYALYPQGGTLNRITNLTGGAFSPAVSPDGCRIAFKGYTADGYDIHVMNTTDGCAVPVTGFKPNGKRIPCRTAPPGPVRRTAAATDQPYSPWYTLRPRSWYPLCSLESNGTAAGPFDSERYDFYLGAGFTGTDVLQRHIMRVTVLRQLDSTQTRFRAGYAYNRFMPVLYAAAGLETDGNRICREQYRAGVTVPGITGLFNAIFRTSSNLELSRTAPGIPGRGLVFPEIPSSRYHNISAELDIRTYDYFKSSISPENGLRFNTYASAGSRSLGSTRGYYNFVSGLNGYLPSRFPHHVIAPSVYLYAGELRGYGSAQLVRTILEYRLPLWYPDRGIGTWPFFIGKTSLHVSAGRDWWPGQSPAHVPPITAAVDLNAFITLMHSFNMTLTLHLEWDRYDEFSGNFSLGLPFFNGYTGKNIKTGSYPWDLSRKLPRIRSRR